MQLLTLTEGPDHVCYRYRVKAFAEYLQSVGWEVRDEPLERSWSGFVRQLGRVAKVDVTILQRRLMSRPKLHLLRSKARCLIYDVDDAVFLRDSNSAKSPYSARRDHRFRAVVRAADAVLAGNRFLVEEVNRRAGRACALFFPTCVDPRRYPLTQDGLGTNRLDLVWIGSQATLSSLERGFGHLSVAASCLESLRLKVVCDVFPTDSPLPIVQAKWSAASEARELAAADVGISWLPRHPYTDGKCGLKVLQYMAAGLPVVTNPVGVHRDLVRHGQTGFLASTAEEWSAALSRLAGDRQLRRQMGAAGRAFVEREYSVQVWGPQFASLLVELSRPRSPRESQGSRLAPWAVPRLIENRSPLMFPPEARLGSDTSGRRSSRQSASQIRSPGARRA